MPIKILLILLGILFLVTRRRRSSSVRLYAVDSGSGNVAIVLKGVLAGRPALFQLDTGYAGPPVLSSNYLAASQDPVVQRAARRPETGYATIIERIVNLDDGERDGAVDNFLARSRCHAYTSGCTMRLMGIGSIVEQQADMFLCDALRFSTSLGTLITPKRERGDVLVTNPLPSSVHILTFDYLRHLAPVIIDNGRGRLEILDRPTYSFDIRPLRTAGGSPVVDVVVDGVAFACTLDTGSPGGVCIGSQAASRLSTRVRPTGLTVSQTGVNDERVCSSIVIASAVSVHDVKLVDVPIFVNNIPVDHTDGYVGMGLVRALDIYIGDDGTMGIRASGVPHVRADEYPGTPGTCSASE